MYDMEECFFCKHWVYDLQRKDPKVGYCCQQPPSLISHNGSLLTFWPSPDCDKHCARFRGKHETDLRIQVDTILGGRSLTALQETSLYSLCEEAYQRHGWGDLKSTLAEQASSDSQTLEVQFDIRESDGAWFTVARVLSMPDRLRVGGIIASLWESQPDGKRLLCQLRSHDGPRYVTPQTLHLGGSVKDLDGIPVWHIATSDTSARITVTWFKDLIRQVNQDLAKGQNNQAFRWQGANYNWACCDASR
jgi:hypothetical protein